MDPAVVMNHYWNRFRWHLAMAISRLGWWVMPEPQRSMAYKDFSDALHKIKLRESLRAP